MAWNLINSKILPQVEVLFCYGNRRLIGRLVQAPDIFEDNKANKYPNVKYWKPIEALPAEIIQEELSKVAIEKEKAALVTLFYKATQKINEVDFFGSNEQGRLELRAALEKTCGVINE